MGSAADDKKSLPPPGILNRNSVWLAGIGWASAMIHNAINHRPPVKSGVHRQFLLTTIGWFLGYHLTKHENYTYAKLDRDMNEYVKLHPEKFQPKEKRRLQRSSSLSIQCVKQLLRRGEKRTDGLFADLF